MLSGADGEALKLVEEAISLSDEQKYPFWLEVVTIMRGFVIATGGNSSEGLSVAQKALANLAATGAIGNHTYFLGLVAQICELKNRPDEAQALICQALDMATATGERWFEAELLRLKGRWLAVRFRDIDAEQCFLNAIALARKQNARTWEVRAALELRRLRNGRKRRQGN